MSAKRQIFTLFIGAAGLIAPLSSSAASPYDAQCAEEILTTYYPEKYVAKALDKFNVPKTQHAAILSELAEKNHEVIPLVEEKAAKMHPNPLRDPQHHKEAVKIFRETLYNLFAKVLKAHGISDKEEIQSMLDYVQQQKAEDFVQCREKHQEEEENQGQSMQDDSGEKQHSQNEIEGEKASETPAENSFNS